MMNLKSQVNVRRILFLITLVSEIISKGNFLENDLFVLFDLYGITLDDVNKFITLVFGGEAFVGLNTQKNTSEYKELRKLYGEVLKNTSNALKEIDVNDPTDLFVSYMYLYKNGYLSHEKNFMYSSDMKDFLLLGGVDVVRGKGLCRAISGFFTDLCVEHGYSAFNLYVNFYNNSDRCKCEKNDIHSEKTKAIKKFVDFIKFFVKHCLVSNHVITLINFENSQSYLFDPTNNYYLVNALNNELVIPGVENCSMRYFKNSYYFLNIFGMEKNNLKKVRDTMCLSGISYDEYLNSYVRALEKCRQSNNVFEDLYIKNFELYEDIYSICEKQDGLFGRMLPIISDINKVRNKIIKKNKSI